MAWARNPAASIRSNIVDHLVDRFLGLRAGADGYAYTWNKVLRAELAAADRMMPAIAVLETTERLLKDVNQAHTRSLPLVIEFSVRTVPGEAPSVTFNRALTDVQRALYADGRCGGLAISLTETHNDPDYGATADGAVGGFVYATVEYRHKSNDPRKLSGE